MTGDTGQHLGPDLLLIVKGENEVGPAFAGKGSVGAGFTLELPTNPIEGGKDAPCLGGRPMTHAA